MDKGKGVAMNRRWAIDFTDNSIVPSSRDIPHLPGFSRASLDQQESWKGLMLLRKKRDFVLPRKNRASNTRESRFKCKRIAIRAETFSHGRSRLSLSLSLLSVSIFSSSLFASVCFVSLSRLLVKVAEVVNGKKSVAYHASVPIPRNGTICSLRAGIKGPNTIRAPRVGIKGPTNRASHMLIKLNYLNSCLILSVLPAKFNLRFPTISDKTVYTTEAAPHDMNQYG
ncbi:hypothetical protein TEA_024383 [Camellia sinensis var. sinensis]|uniref:Uncharacterized protein n=1 Tax=Camellia sinensis var. sinensis TaxID=542762 RepID=A0A4S4D3U6_CAMSN|nr:hypothetical protein TEA_024383 [Camellia sinensis var. sinensis]